MALRDDVASGAARGAADAHERVAQLRELGQDVGRHLTVATLEEPPAEAKIHMNEQQKLK